MFCSMPVWAIAMAKFCGAWGNLMLMSKLPSYLRSVLNVSIQNVSTHIENIFQNGLFINAGSMDQNTGPFFKTGICSIKILQIHKNTNTYVSVFLGFSVFLIVLLYFVVDLITFYCAGLYSNCRSQIHKQFTKK